MWLASRLRLRTGNHFQHPGILLLKKIVGWADVGGLAGCNLTDGFENTLPVLTLKGFLLYAGPNGNRHFGPALTGKDICLTCP